jgi:FkbM family methyltransferase
MKRWPDEVQRMLPDPLFYRAVAAAFRVRAEQRLLLLDALVARECVAVDAGAWWGPWTYWLARRASEVWAFEPNPLMAKYLARVVAPNVHVENVALSARRGDGTLFVPEGVGRDALATLSAAHRRRDAVAVNVRLEALDVYRLDRVGFVKVDVEGHELELLYGAERTLERWMPTLLVEIEQIFHDQPIHQIFDWLFGRGYTGWFRRGRRWRSLSTFDIERDQRPDVSVKSTRYVNNFVFTPIGRTLP